MHDRISNKMTGAVWQRTIFDKLVSKNKLRKDEALRKMLELYIINQKKNIPVSAWSVEV